jgi:sugar phosphate isomerase/epimerase
MGIKYTSSPWGFRNNTLEEYCVFMKKIGITDLTVMFDDPFPLAFNSNNMSDNDIKEINETVLKYSQRNIAVCGGKDYSVTEGLEKEIEITKKHLDISAKLGAEFLILFAGWIKEENATDKTYEQVSESITEIARYAKKHNITIVMENHGGITRTGKQVARIMKKIKGDNVGALYDPANFRFHGEDPYKALLDTKEYIKFTHFKNCKEINGQMQYCRLNEGIIDYKPIFNELKKFYNGYYSLEYEETSDAESGTIDDFEFVKSMME